MAYRPWLAQAIGSGRVGHCIMAGAVGRGDQAGAEGYLLGGLAVFHTLVKDGALIMKVYWQKFCNDAFFVHLLGPAPRLVQNHHPADTTHRIIHNNPGWQE